MRRPAQGLPADQKAFKLYSGEEHIMDCKEGSDCQMMHR